VQADKAVLAAADCVVIETDHSHFDWEEIVTCSRIVVDTRNATAGVIARSRARIVKL
jgi:UDP-N-acetyl-D-glucosamine dehydrogenase